MRDVVWPIVWAFVCRWEPRGARSTIGTGTPLPHPWTGNERSREGAGTASRTFRSEERSGGASKSAYEKTEVLPEERIRELRKLMTIPALAALLAASMLLGATDAEAKKKNRIHVVRGRGLQMLWHRAQGPPGGHNRFRVHNRRRRPRRPPGQRRQLLRRPLSPHPSGGRIGPS